MSTKPGSAQNGGLKRFPPHLNTTPKLIILVGKPHGLLGQLTILGNPHLFVDVLIVDLLFFEWIFVPSGKSSWGFVDVLLVDLFLKTDFVPYIWYIKSQFFSPKPFGRGFLVHFFLASFPQIFRNGHGNLVICG